METGFFKSYDNTSHFYRVWNYAPERKSILIMHRGHEHSGRLEHFATDRRFSEYNVFSYDQRGLGHTETPVSTKYMDYVRDLDSFVHHIEAQYGVRTRDLLLVANSIGGVIVAGWLHDFAPQIAGQALMAPAFTINLYVPLAVPAISMVSSLNKNFEVPSYVKSKVLTHDIEQQKAYDSDKLITRSINGALLIDMHRHGKRLVDDAQAINTPTLILSAEKDYVVKRRSQQEFFVKLDTLNKEFRVIKGAYHGLLFETMRDEVYDEIATFATRCFTLTPPPATLEPDRFTFEEYNILSFGMIPTLERWNFSLQRLLLPVVGKMSKGMRLGMKYGFDSGISLDYVYQNKPQGAAGIGKLVDKGYLNAIGWRGIRLRKENLVEMLEKAITERQNKGIQKIKILDIAGGTGFYLFEIKRKFPDLQIVINEFIKSNIEQGQAVIDKEGWNDVRFTNYDCFDSATYEKLDFRPDIVVVSGIFELFGDNEVVSRAVRGAASICSDTGCVIYTGQPWHPQLKMIAYVLNSHRGCDWVMRRRSQKELDKIFNLAGFLKDEMRIDDFGIFTVSCAHRKS